jgi:hypothetical protein
MPKIEGLQPNSVISKLQETGGRTPAPFLGWIGSGAGEGKTRLHLNIHELGYYIEFDNGDLVHSMDVQDNVMPFGAKALWLKADARVRLSRSVRTSATQISRFLSRAASTATPNVARTWMLGAPIGSPNAQNFSGRSPTGGN